MVGVIYDHPAAGDPSVPLGEINKDKTPEAAVLSGGDEFDGTRPRRGLGRRTWGTRSSAPSCPGWGIFGRRACGSERGREIAS